jgi:OPA family glycerol-3-phosphate transporter-like MFS transporter
VSLDQQRQDADDRPSVPGSSEVVQHSVIDTVPSHETHQFRAAQWRMLLATMFCYLFFYTGRQTFGFAIPGIQQELGLSKATLGWVSAAMLWTYALGQSVNGNLGDKYGGRRLMSLGAVLSCGLNWVVSVGTNLTGLVIPWAANGYAQSMGWAPGSRVLSNWWPHRNRGKVYGAYVFAAGMASVLAFTTSTLILEFDLSWRWIFRLPVLLLLIGGVSYYFLARDRPEDLGFPPLPSDEDSETGNDDQPNTEVADDDSSWNRYRHVLSNRAFLIASVSIGFQNLARYGLLIWVPVHFLGEDWKNSPTKWVSIALPIGMALGAMTNGWLSDRCFRSNRSHVIGLFMLLAAGCSLIMFLLPRDHALSVPMLVLTGFFAYGPQSAFWALCPDLLGKERAGTGTGVMNTFAYAFAGLGEPLIGWMIEARGQTELIFAVVAASCLIGAVISPFIRR